MNPALLHETTICSAQIDERVPVYEQEVEDRSGKDLLDSISTYWTYNFFHQFHIATRIQKGNKSPSPAKVALNNKYLRDHLVLLKEAGSDLVYTYSLSSGPLSCNLEHAHKWIKCIKFNQTKCSLEKRSSSRILSSYNCILLMGSVRQHLVQNGP